MRDLSYKIGPTMQPAFVSIKLEQDFRPNEAKPFVLNQHSVVYHFSCDLWDADYVDYTTRHLFQPFAEHKYSSIGKHLTRGHGSSDHLNESRFTILNKCQSKFHCFVFEMLFIKRLKPNIHEQTESINAKPLVYS